MAMFHYRARDFTGKQVTGEIEAEELIDARRLVSGLKLIPLELTLVATPATAPPDSGAAAGSDQKSAGLSQASSGSSQESSNSDSGGSDSDATNSGPLNLILSTLGVRQKQPKVEDLMLFFQQLQTVFSVGVPLVKGLTLIEDQIENKILKGIVGSVIKDVSEGRLMSQALARYPRQFDALAINLLRAGEASGQMEDILTRISEMMAQRLEQQAKIKSALFYPKIVAGMIVVVFVVVIGFVIPKFESFFSNMGGALPLPTRIMLGLSHALLGYWYVIAIVVSGGVFWFKKWVATPKGRALYDWYILKVPVFGTLLMQNDLLSFCFILETLFRSGIKINESLTILSGTLANETVRQDVGLIQKAIDAGETMSAGLKRGRTFPKLVVNLMTIGEEAGEVEASLNHLARYYKLQMDHRLNMLSKAID